MKPNEAARRNFLIRSLSLCGAALLAGCVGVPFSITLRGNETMHAKKIGRRKFRPGSPALATQRDFRMCW